MIEKNVNISPLFEVDLHKVLNALVNYELIEKCHFFAQMGDITISYEGEERGRELFVIRRKKPNE